MLLSTRIWNSEKLLCRLLCCLAPAPAMASWQGVLWRVYGYVVFAELPAEPQSEINEPGSEAWQHMASSVDLPSGVLEFHVRRHLDIYKKCRLWMTMTFMILNWLCTFLIMLERWLRWGLWLRSTQTLHSSYCSNCCSSRVQRYRSSRCRALSCQRSWKLQRHLTHGNLWLVTSCNSYINGKFPNFSDQEETLKWS